MGVMWRLMIRSVPGGPIHCRSYSRPFTRASSLLDVLAVSAYMWDQLPAPGSSPRVTGLVGSNPAMCSPAHAGRSSALPRTSTPPYGLSTRKTSLAWYDGTAPLMSAPETIRLAMYDGQAAMLGSGQ